MRENNGIYATLAVLLLVFGVSLWLQFAVINKLKSDIADRDAKVTQYTYCPPGFDVVTRFREPGWECRYNPDGRPQE